MSASQHRNLRRQKQKRQQHRERVARGALKWAEVAAKAIVDDVKSGLKDVDGKTSDQFWEVMQRETEDKLLEKKYGIHRQTGAVPVGRADNETERAATD